ncbi:hypothetical protein J2855_001784 [Agrobacterium tumefaciens]|uniref:hypothetical protein n=1 Tax=Agrobacterium tumefaciens TaxID=358 RepID=UPI0013AE9B6A|nr:hypothetical protein [Agrobacterium tumefaciens]MBP2508149.1 hypothetical protein [Agrobacterium tumefaciens]MBP2517301.1 hypothetical protein [Agrobacterium tumefaciens]MBP2575935.1 hypothetical protein [Agrobacterium tumefaciens]MBP2594291.1 hypothetical protein [Agrobacterium tumefaciens]
MANKLSPEELGEQGNIKHSLRFAVAVAFVLVAKQFALGDVVRRNRLHVAVNDDRVPSLQFRDMDFRCLDAGHRLISGSCGGSEIGGGWCFFVAADDQKLRYD